jgi:glucokinase
MSGQAVIGIDMGGTWLRGAIVHNGAIITRILHRPTDKNADAEEVLITLYDLIHELIEDNGRAVQDPGPFIRYTIRAIGIGVPGLVDSGAGIVYDVLNIPSWKELPLRARLEERFGLPVFLDNDANCFAWGEYSCGKGRGRNSLVGLTIGTGLGAGIVLNGRLYPGASGAAGEFGMVGYLDKNYEYYASGSFFREVHGLDGQTVFERAGQKDPEALQIYSAFGAHLGNAVRMILYTYDVDLILLGGSVSRAWPFFKDSLHRTLASHAFARSLHRLEIAISELENSGILGAAALCIPS